MNYTSNYQLNQWEAGDRVQRTDFNADNAKIDAALAVLAAKTETKAEASELARKAEAVFGFYIGDGEADRVIELGFTPQAVMLWNSSGAQYRLTGSNSRDAYGGLALPGHACHAFSVCEGGFLVHHIYKSESVSQYSNTNTVYYYYVAFR